MASEYDFIVLGGGSGGSACSRRAAAYGAKVAIIDKGVTRDANGVRTGAGFGGTCVNVGCVPKKIMWFAASQRESMLGHVSVAGGYGFNVPDAAGVVDWAGLKARRDKYVDGLNKKYGENWSGAGITVLTGEGQLVSKVDGKTTVRVRSASGEEQLVSAPKVLLCVGGTPSMPTIPGIELAISSDGFFDLEKQPRKVAVIGAGYIAVEMAGILHGLGSETHLFFRGETVLRHGFDPYIVETLMMELEAHGPNMHPNSTPTKLYRAPDGTITLVTSSTDGSQSSTREHTGFDCVLVATGRKPNVASLGVEQVGVALNPSGFVEVDAFENTSADGIFAIGDVTSTGYELTPVAIAAGRRLADRLFGGEPQARIEYANIATVVFSHPPIGTIGLTEPQARAEYGDDAIRVKKARFASMMYAFNGADSKVKTALKLVLLGPEERVVGLHCIGPHSDEMMQGFAVAVRMGATRADMEAAVAIHPTIAEEFVTFGGWGQAADGKRPMLPPYLQPRAALGPSSRAGLFVAGAAVGAAAVGAAWLALRRN